jgi:acetyl esterase/lipase
MFPPLHTPSILGFTFLACLLLASPLTAGPTDERDWTSTAGTRVRAVATAVDGGSVHLKTSDGREIVVPLAKLVDADRELLRDHFKPGDAPATEAPAAGGKSRPLTTALAHPAGEASGPHEAGQGSTYFIYIPRSLKENRKAPLLLYTGAGGGQANSVKSHIKGAELNGWIVAASVESRNGNSFDVNHEHARRCVEHLIKILPIDPDRVYFTGNSGGGAMAFINSARLRSAGAMPIIGYNSDAKWAKNGHYYVLGGATDYNRYLSADGAAGARARGFHRIYPGAHAGAPEWILTESMTWLNGRYLEDRKSGSSLADERLDWEIAMIAWIHELKSKEPHRAYDWCRFLRDTYKISGPNAATVSALAAELGKDPLNTRYAEGLDAINDFSAKYFTGLGSGSKFSHTTPKIESAAGKLMEKFAGVPHIDDVVKQIGQKTCAK